MTQIEFLEKELRNLRAIVEDLMNMLKVYTHSRHLLQEEIERLKGELEAAREVK